jgi:hypothetical protein
MHALQDAQRDAIRLRLLANRDAPILARLKDDGITSSFYLCVVQISQRGVAEDHALNLFVLLDRLREELIKAMKQHREDLEKPHPYAGAPVQRVVDADDLSKMRWMFLWPNFNLHDALRDARIPSTLATRDLLARTPGEQDFLLAKWNEEESAVQGHLGDPTSRKVLDILSRVRMFVKGFVYDRELEDPSGFASVLILALFAALILLPPGGMPIVFFISFGFILCVAVYRLLFPARRNTE